MADAVAACDAAKALGIDPAQDGTWIYADIENSEKYANVSSAWIRGWMQQMWSNQPTQGLGPFRGGFYFPTSNPWLIKRYCAALKALGEGRPPTAPDIRLRTNFYAQTPVLGCDAHPAAFNPEKPDCHQDGVVIWQYAIGCFEIPKVWSVDKDLATERGFLSMWRTPKHVQTTGGTGVTMNVEDSGDQAATSAVASLGKGIDESSDTYDDGGSAA
jgi:hypothetical protein